MKTVILIAMGISALFAYTNFSNVNFKENTKEGIHFHQGTWEEALELAKKENKVIFLDVYATWCGPCKMLKRLTFSNKKVGSFYNENFINVALDGESGEGPAVARLYGVRAYPSLLFVDSNGKLINHSAGFRPPSDFIDLGKSIIGK
ncbi:hypothetical protein Emtol_0223 (plasmid) [Emticicia oligotrophica DSM 17448]|uniref:Thioredoxin domain-containing protein n=1 Tax=Emticicia oligotrophica (strain DSM 17448 / CIP 109782 / MTCC 6937 / GPTSA100-15) TaxID=929562 RepID=A0ABM5N7K5_EMTOG|nr:thioredoxin family protein [Emticicia oligotrophica]AFK05495.1 hypothetical protein Emtol_0223 [Emticicia oligotrophica DSM 17448]